MKDAIPRCAHGHYSNTPDGKAPGYYGDHHCADCAAHAEAGCAAFDTAVQRGEFNARGFTPNEWKRFKARGLGLMRSVEVRYGEFGSGMTW